MTKAKYADLDSGPIKFRGGSFLVEALNELPKQVSTDLKAKGMRRAAMKLRTLLRRDAPRGKTGTLRKAIGVQRSRRRNSAWVAVGLTERYYYKTLEFDTERGKALHPFFEASIRRHSPAILEMIQMETLKALHQYRRKTAVRSAARLGRK